MIITHESKIKKTVQSIKRMNPITNSMKQFQQIQLAFLTANQQYNLNIVMLSNKDYKIQKHSMNLYEYNSSETSSRHTTDQDSSSDRDEELLYRRTIPSKHKTELCKTFSELGSCPYQFKCRFAHGKHELVKITVKTQSKNRKCHGFWKNGCCPYGMRCQFGHSQTSWEDSAILLGLQAACISKKAYKHSKLIHLLN